MTPQDGNPRGGVGTTRKLLRLAAIAVVWVGTFACTYPLLQRVIPSARSPDATFFLFASSALGFLVASLCVGLVVWAAGRSSA